MAKRKNAAGGSKPKKPAKPRKRPTKPKMGRPSKYTPELGELICSIMADEDKPKGLGEVAIDPRVNVSRSVIFKWLMRHADFRDRYAHARKVQADRIAWSAKEVAAHAHELTPDDHATIAKYDIAGPYMHAKMAQARLMVDTLKWMAGKLHPQKYGKSADEVEAATDSDPIDLGEAEKRMGDMDEQAAAKLYAEAVRA